MMRLGDNINLILHDHARDTDLKSARDLIRHHLDKFNKQAFALIFMPGAGAPVELEPWMQAGLGGCTGESCALHAKKDKMNFIIINSMTVDEQAAANEKILGNKNVNLSNLNIINDPGFALAKILNLQESELKTVGERKAYLPQALIFNGVGCLITNIQNVPTEPGKPRAAEPYVGLIHTELLNLGVSEYSRKHPSPGSSPKPQHVLSGSSAPSEFKL